MKKHFTKLVFTFLTIVLLGQAGISQTYIWGGPGDPNSEFAGGLNDWTTTGTPDSALWVWEADGKADRGAYSGEKSIIESPSVSNGAMVFDSDFYDNAGTQGNFGKGIAPAPQVGELISPEFSCEGHESVWIQFNQSFRNYKSTTTYAVSIDGGATWIDGHPFNTDVPVNEAIDPASVKLIDISDIAAGQANVKFKFIFNANYYFWIIDDVYVLEDPPGDPQILGTWYPPNRFNSPQSQIANDSMYFIMDVANYGGKNVSNILGGVEIINTDSDLTYFKDSIYFDLDVNDTTRISFKSFMPSETMDTGLYVARYTIYADSALSPSIKEYNQYFRINLNNLENEENGVLMYNNYYSISDLNHDSGVSYQGSGADGPIYDAYNINYYKMADWAQNDLIKYRLTSVLLGVYDENWQTNDYVSFPANVFIFELADTLDNQLFNFDFSDGIIVDGNPSSQLTYIGYGAENIENAGQGELAEVPLTSADDEYDYVEVKPGKKYFIASLWPKGTRYYQTYDNLYDGTKRFYYYFNDLYQANSLTYVNNDETPFGLIYVPDYGSWVQPVIMNILVPNATEEDLLPDNSVTLVQNPVDTELGVKVNFENNVGKATMVVHNINGDVIDMRTVKNIQKGSYKFHTGNLPVGTYIFTLFTKDKLLSKKFVVQH